MALLTSQMNAQNYRYNNSKCDYSWASENPYFDKLQIEKYFKVNLNSDRIKALNGSIFLLIYLDVKGKACCSAIRNTTDSDISDLNLFKLIRHLPKWKPALSSDEVFKDISQLQNEPIESSVVLQLKFSNSELQIDTTNIDSLDLQNGYSVSEVQIENKNFKESKNKPKIFCEVFNKENSRTPWDMSRAISIDKKGIIWCGTDNGIVKFQNNKMSIFNYKNSALKKRNCANETDNRTCTIMCSAIDSFDNKWFSDGYNIYKFDNVNWTVYDTSHFPIQWCTSMITDKNNVYFATHNGIIISSDGTWNFIDCANNKFPSSKIYSIFIDSKSQKWIGTRNGNICITDSTCLGIEDSNSPLKSASIICAAEDWDNNIWFGLNNSENKGGIAVFLKNGEWLTFNITNSNIPGNTIEDIKIDKKRKLIWMSIAGVGIVLYHNEYWYAYTRKNSKVPATYIPKIELDKNGDLWAATFAGLLHLKLLGEENQYRIK